MLSHERLLTVAVLFTAACALAAFVGTLMSLLPPA
jgi:hypothetical protein